MANEPSTRLLDHLPAVYRAYRGTEADDARDLRDLLGVLEELLFAAADSKPALPGIESRLAALPVLFAPLGTGGDAGARAPDPFVPWLATWFAFAPYALVEPERLRHVVAGIVPLYGLRGTREFMQKLLRLCFDEIDDVRVEDAGLSGLRVGASKIGIDSLLAQQRPFWFRVEVEHRKPAAGPAGFERRLRAVIDFAKPAHTAYELKLREAASTRAGARE